MAKFLDGSPVSSGSNPYNKVAGVDGQDIIGGVDDTSATMQTAMDNLDAYGSSPVTSASAAGRPSAGAVVPGTDGM